MPGIFGYYDPERLLGYDALNRMRHVLDPAENEVGDILATSWGGIGIVNYPGFPGIVASSVDHRFAVFGCLESLAGKCEPHSIIAGKCFGSAGAPENLLDLRGGYVATSIDEMGRVIRLVSDRFGSYPMYVAQYRSAWIFASQVKVVLAVLPEKPKLDPVSVATMLSYGEMVGKRTLIDGIHALPAATSMCFSSSGLEAHKYWQYTYEENKNSNWDDSIDQVSHLLKKSVERSLLACRSPAVPLSGGIDSRILLDMACNGQMNPAAYTWGLAGCRDIQYAQEITRRLNCHHEVFKFQEDYLVTHGKRGVWLTEGHTPAINFHVLPFVDMMASRGHDTILDGIGGDGLLGGIYISASDAGNPDMGKAAEALWRWRWDGFVQGWRPAELHQINGVASDAFKGSYLSYPGATSLDKAMAFLVDNRLRRTTMCGSELLRSRLPVRQPFVDADLVDAVRTLPHEWRKRHRFYLSLLKSHAPKSASAPWQKTMLSASSPYWLQLLSMAWQKGYGISEKKFGLPNLFRHKSTSDFPGWFRGLLRPYVEQTLLSSRALDRNIIPPDAMRSAVSLHMNNERDNSSLIGAMMSIELFCQLFIDGDGY